MVSFVGGLLILVGAFDLLDGNIEQIWKKAALKIFAGFALIVVSRTLKILSPGDE